MEYSTIAHRKPWVVVAILSDDLVWHARLSRLYDGLSQPTHGFTRPSAVYADSMCRTLEPISHVPLCPIVCH